MSQEAVELVRQLIPPEEVDLVRLMRDPAIYGALVEATAAVVAPDLECVHHLPGGANTYRGAEGLRQVWNDWLAPWSSYQVVVEELVDLGDRVLAIVRDRARRAGVDGSVEVHAASIWTVRDGRLARVEFYPDRQEALEAAGLPGRSSG